ncbi:MAG TPA: DNA repair protein RecN [Anaeromyxobacteraceae bacterium]|nr:DNA repair protein RecN [Anaeromyxobacteraceae bacterium]
MLTALRLFGFAIVDHAEVEFGPGLTVLTGETGAGKSILLEALHLVMGGRLGGEVLREGAEEAAVEALFELAPGHPVLARLAAAGVPLPGGGAEVLVRRTLSRTGRGRAYVNGTLCTVSMLEAALRGLVDVTAQHGHVALLDEATHLDLIDAYARAAARGRAGGEPEEDEATLSERYREAYRSFATLSREREALVAAREERVRRKEYLVHQLGELEAAEVRPSEDEELERERALLRSAGRLTEAARAAEALVYGEEGSASEKAARAERALAEAGAIDARLGPVLALIRSARAEAEEAGRALARYADLAGGDPERLLELEERLEVLRGLARKHGGSLAAALERARAMRVELAALEAEEERAGSLEGELAAAGARASRLAGLLTRLRERAASAFGREVERVLAALAMERCRLLVAFSPPEHGLSFDGLALGPDGAERARILIGPNPGEPPRPLARIASGGELSRVLLAAKRVLSSADPVDAYVLDEVDAGLGGGAAEAVGRLLSEVARGRQVICVTHLPQVAAFADQHLTVAKRVKGGRTSAEVASLATLEARRAEVARMLAGETVTAAAHAHAGELIARATGPGRRAAEASRRAARPGGSGGRLSVA